MQSAVCAVVGDDALIGEMHAVEPAEDEDRVGLCHHNRQIKGESVVIRVLAELETAALQQSAAVRCRQRKVAALLGNGGDVADGHITAGNDGTALAVQCGNRRIQRTERACRARTVARAAVPHIDGLLRGKCRQRAEARAKQHGKDEQKRFAHRKILLICRGKPPLCVYYCHFSIILHTQQAKTACIFGQNFMVLNLVHEKIRSPDGTSDFWIQSSTIVGQSEVENAETPVSVSAIEPLPSTLTSAGRTLKLFAPASPTSAFGMAISAT